MLTVSQPVQFREQVRARIVKIIGGGSSSSADAKNSINLERGIFNFALKEATKAKVVKKWENPIFAQIYVDRLRSVLSNLPHIVTQLQSGEIAPQAVAFMTHQEFQPDRWKQLLDLKMKRDASTANGELVEASTDMYTCKKCKSKRCTYYEMQTRSADEPATVFITCLDCGKRWRS
jgi:transcription elongation factor S-II